MSRMNAKNTVNKNRGEDHKRIKENKQIDREQNRAIRLKEDQSKAAAFLEFWADEFKTLKERNERSSISTDASNTWVESLLKEVPSLNNFAEQWIIDSYI